MAPFEWVARSEQDVCCQSRKGCSLGDGHGSADMGCVSAAGTSTPIVKRSRECYSTIQPARSPVGSLQGASSDSILAPEAEEKLRAAHLSHELLHLLLHVVIVSSKVWSDGQ